MTTLSTVGFGDMYPQNNYERFFVTIFLLFMGYVCFSYMNANYSEMIIEYLSIDQDFDKSDELHKFIQLLRYFNNDVAIGDKQINDLVRFFNYKWNAERNLCL
jgi:hypothetical protein